MSFEINSANPVVKAIILGTAPRPAQIAAARGALPISSTDLLEVLVALAKSKDDELSKISQQTLVSQDVNELSNAFGSNEIAASVLGYFVEKDYFPKEVQELALTNKKTPNASIVKFAQNTRHGELLELVSFNQQLLIQNPDLIEAIIKNPSRTAEAERRASETKREFFEKERGAQQIANELRAQGKEAAAEFVEAAEVAEAINESELTFDDAFFLADFIEVPDAEVDDSWLALDYLEDIFEESEEQRQAIVSKILGEMKGDGDDLTNERISMVSLIMKANMKGRVKLAMKGNREARTILIRDPNRIVAQAVINNPRITEQEVESIASMRAVPEDVLRLIAINRNWTRNYMIMHKLAQNPRTPIANVLTILTRLQLRDLSALSKNRNVSDAVRRQALRLAQARTGR